MPSKSKADVLCKTVRQYNREPISMEDMAKLKEIAEDYRRVKNEIYARYGGIGSLAKLYPGYTIQNEMTKSGLRAELAMPSVYFYLAIFDALGDIKAQWTRTKTEVLSRIGQNEMLTVEEKHYLRFVLKSTNLFDAVLNQKQAEIPSVLRQAYMALAGQVDSEKLHRYLCRQVRKCHIRQMNSNMADGFSVSERAYRYADHGIYISTKQNRKRVFVPLTDQNSYKSQLYIKLFPEAGNIEVRAPIHVTVRSHEDYIQEVGLGMVTMLTTDQGRRYGEHLGEYQAEYTVWLREQAAVYRRNQTDNPGRKKYNAKKKRYIEQLHSYINQEINRFLQVEKPETVYLVKLPRPQAGGVNKKINQAVTLWQRGYIRKRLKQKCGEQSVAFVEVIGKNISSECSQCGLPGEKKEGIFTCPNCGCSLEEKTNTAKNTIKRGQEGKIIYDQKNSIPDKQS